MMTIIMEFPNKAIMIISGYPIKTRTHCTVVIVIFGPVSKVDGAVPLGVVGEVRLFMVSFGEKRTY